MWVWHVRHAWIVAAQSHQPRLWSWGKPVLGRFRGFIHLCLLEGAGVSTLTPLSTPFCVEFDVVMVLFLMVRAAADLLLLLLGAAAIYFCCCLELLHMVVIIILVSVLVPRWNPAVAGAVF